MSAPPIIYSIFPRLAGHTGAFAEHAARARAMGFDWVHLYPFFEPGFSGSVFAVRSHYRLDPAILPPGCDDGQRALADAVRAMHDLGLRVMMDLPVAYTSRDADIVERHPTWFRRDADGRLTSPSAADLDDTRRVTVFGDLAEVDNLRSPDRQALWAYWTALVQHYLRLGFDGFRCDAACRVPPELWRRLIAVGKGARAEALFVASALGCRMAEVRALSGCGFDYFYNSFRWWRLDTPWALEQQAEMAPIAASIAFAESHDEPRLMAETGGLVQVQKQRYALAAAFSRGLSMPMGYEFGARRPLHATGTRAEDWEPEAGPDLRAFVERVNRLKRTEPVLAAEGRLRAVTPLDRPAVALEKTAPGAGEALVLLVNKDWHRPGGLPASVALGSFAEPPRLCRVCGDAAEPDALPSAGDVPLAPAEVVYAIGRRAESA